MTITIPTNIITFPQFYNSPITQHSNNSCETFEVYSTPLEFRLDILQALQQQSSVFAAISLAKETNRLNGRTVVSEYDMKKIKLYFLSDQNEQLENENIKYEKAKIKMEEIQRNEIVNNKMRNMQKGYMRMLTKSVYKNSI